MRFGGVPSVDIHPQADFPLLSFLSNWAARSAGDYKLSCRSLPAINVLGYARLQLSIKEGDRV